jgi:hypothetical protein
MQALDNFISPVPGFDGDIPISAVLVLAQPPAYEPMSDPSTGASAISLKTRVGKRKATANLTPRKEARKTTGRSAGGVEINEPTPKTSASTPSGPQRKILIQRSKRYIHHVYISSLTIFCFVSLCSECPRTSTLTPLQRVLQPAVSPQRWTSPRVLKLRELRQIPQSRQAQKVREAPLVLAVL